MRGANGDDEVNNLLRVGDRSRVSLVPDSVGRISRTPTRARVAADLAHGKLLSVLFSAYFFADTRRS